MILTTQMEDGITGTDVRQEGITETLALSSTFHQAGNINNVEEGWHFAAE